MQVGDAYDDDWLNVDDLGPLGPCPVIPDSVQIGWVWEPFGDNGPTFLPFATWHEFGRPIAVTYDDGSSVQWI